MRRADVAGLAEAPLPVVRLTCCEESEAACKALEVTGTLRRFSLIERVRGGQGFGMKLVRAKFKLCQA